MSRLSFRYPYAVRWRPRKAVQSVTSAAKAAKSIVALSASAAGVPAPGGAGACLPPMSGRRHTWCCNTWIFRGRWMPPTSGRSDRSHVEEVECSIGFGADRVDREPQSTGSWGPKWAGCSATMLRSCFARVAGLFQSPARSTCSAGSRGRPLIALDEVMVRGRLDSSSRCRVAG